MRSTTPPGTSNSTCEDCALLSVIGANETRCIDIRLQGLCRNTHDPAGFSPANQRRIRRPSLGGRSCGMSANLMAAVLAIVVGEVQAEYPGDNDPIWVLATMPLISAVVGYATNVIALKMTFYPIEFVGIKIWQPEDSPLGCFGWQGIIPAKAAKMASKCVTLMMDKLINIKEVFSRLDPDQMSESLEPGLLAVVSKLVTALAAKHMPGTWAFLPESVRDDIVLKALEDIPIFMRAFMSDVKDNIEEVLDVHQMVVSNLVKDKALMNRVFMEVGAKELTFIERSGFWFGLLFGILQTIFWYFYQAGWVLPAGGFLVGYLTNFLALKMIFRPINEHKVCGLRIQGLFLKRQEEVSAHFAEINSKNILTSEAIWEAILTGPKKKNFNEMCTKHTHEFVDLMAGGLRPLMKHLIGEKQFVAMKDEIAHEMIESLPIAIRFGHNYTNKALDMATTIREAMMQLSSADFEGVLHPVFEEDELKLIVIGGVLGAAVGVFQLFFLS